MYTKAVNGETLGIVFAGGKGPPPDILRRLLHDLPTRVQLAAADSGLILAEAAGLRPDWIIGDMDSLLDESCLRYYPAERIIRHDSNKDHTDTELALALLKEKGCDEVWIAGGGGGRIAHLFGIRDLFERNSFPRRWLTDAEDIYCIDQGKNLTLSHLELGDLISVFPLGDSPWRAESQGLQWPLDDVRWKRGLYGLSNVAAAEEITISARQGRFMVILEGVWQR